MSSGCRPPLLAVLYKQYLNSDDSDAFIAKVSRCYTQGTLARLADHRLPQVRRAAVLALGFLGDYEANVVLGQALSDEDRTVRILAENGIREVWTRAGTKQQRRRLADVIRLNAGQKHDQAVTQATQLLQQAPWIAEAWNQRAIAHFALGRFAESIRDCHQALEINPYHFAAAAGMGYAYMQLKNPVSALESFRRALRVNPELEDVRIQVARLTRLIEDK